MQKIRLDGTIEAATNTITTQKKSDQKLLYKDMLHIRLVVLLKVLI